MKITAILCGHNSRADFLQATLDALNSQDLPNEQWELIIIDNASEPPLDTRFDLARRSSWRCVREKHLGLAHARLRGFREAKNELLVLVDDDNVLAPDYMSRCLAAFVADPHLGAAGGKSLPSYETPPPEWLSETGVDLACRDLGDVPLYADWRDAPQVDRVYPTCAPVGAGMAIRAVAFKDYYEATANDPARTALGRRGTNLASGEDNDIIMAVLSAGWKVAYLPELRLRHLIPAKRLTRDYLAALAQSSSRTWVQALNIHGLRPWPPIPRWSVPLRKTRAFITFRAWRSTANYVRWRGACGIFEGRAELSR